MPISTNRRLFHLQNISNVMQCKVRQQHRQQQQLQKTRMNKILFGLSCCLSVFFLAAAADRFFRKISLFVRFVCGSFFCAELKWQWFANFKQFNNSLFSLSRPRSLSKRATERTAVLKTPLLTKVCYRFSPIALFVSTKINFSFPIESNKTVRIRFHSAESTL